jgi:hypothetical protein
MSAVAKVLLSPVGALVGLFKKPKPAPPPPMAQPQAVDRSSSVLVDALASRRGTQANRRSGGGGEAMGGTKTKLGA